MNFIKKTLILSLVLSFVVSNVECMFDFQSAIQELDQLQTDNCVRYEQQEKIKVPDGGYKARSKPLFATLSSKTHCSSFGDYLVQLASIYSIDTTNEKVVDALAKLRMLFNGILIYFGIGRLKALYLLKDLEISKNSSSIASCNKRRNDKNLKNKKLWQYSWLTLNKILRSNYVTGKLGSLGKLIVRGPENSIESDIGWAAVFWTILLTDISEICRQYLKYEMIENK